MQRLGYRARVSTVSHRKFKGFTESQALVNEHVEENEIVVSAVVLVSTQRIGTQVLNYYGRQSRLNLTQLNTSVVNILDDLNVSYIEPIELNYTAINLSSQAKIAADSASKKIVSVLSSL
mgnify:FL=1